MMKQTVEIIQKMISAAKFLANKNSEFARAYLKFIEKKPIFKSFEDACRLPIKEHPKVFAELRGLTLAMEEVKGINTLKNKQREKPPSFEWYRKNISTPGIVDKIQNEYERVLSDKSKWPRLDDTKQFTELLEELETRYYEYQKLIGVIQIRKKELENRAKELEHEMKNMENILIEDQLKSNPFVEEEILKDINNSNWDTPEESLELQVSEQDKKVIPPPSNPEETLGGNYTKKVAEKFVRSFLDVEEKNAKEAEHH